MNNLQSERYKIQSTVNSQQQQQALSQISINTPLNIQTTFEQRYNINTDEIIVEEDETQ